jgi:uncharacterized protein
MTADRRATTVTPPIDLPRDATAEYCRSGQIVELALFGSVLRDDFGPDSDVDFLVTFAPDAHWTLIDLVRMEREPERLAGRDVDLVPRRAVERSENWIRRREILGTARRYCVAG